MKRTPILIEESWEEFKGNYGYIYLTTDVKNHRMYVGKKELPFFDKHYFGSGTLLTRAYRKRPDDFECKPISWAKTKEELNEQERHWIEFLECLSDVDKPLSQRAYYNILPGGDGGRLTGESLQKMKVSRKGKCLGKDNPNFGGKSHTEESREKLRQAMLGKHLSEETRHKISLGNTGKKMPEEFKQKMREMHLGTTLSEETRQRISKNRKGKMTGSSHPLFGTHLTQEQKDNLREKNLYGKSPRAKKVYKFDLQMNLLFVYESRSQVSIDGFTSPKISSVCNKNDRSNDTTYTYHGYIFSSYPDYQMKSNIKEVLDVSMPDYQEKRSKQLSEINMGNSHPHTEESKEKLRQAMYKRLYGITDEEGD